MKFNLPKWLQRETLALPEWAQRGPDKPEFSIVIRVDTDGAMREWFELLGNPTPDQYWIEVAYQCAKMDVQSALVGTPYDPRLAGKGAEIHFSRAPQWALSRYPVGKAGVVNGRRLAGAQLATEGREARGHYQRIRGRLPF